jgi:uncharacterized protein YndB with AHSA1/START domain
MEDRIEQRITIRSTQDKVWQLVTRPGWWLPGSKAEPARSPVRLPVEYGGDSRPYVIDVVRVEPQGYVSFRWASAFGGAAPVPGNATLVEFYLRAVGDEVGVTVVESGFASLDLSDALREDAWKGNTGGWQYELAGLRIRAEQAVVARGDSPLASGAALRHRGLPPPITPGAPDHPRPPSPPVHAR